MLAVESGHVATWGLLMDSISQPQRLTRLRRASTVWSKWWQSWMTIQMLIRLW